MEYNFEYDRPTAVIADLYRPIYSAFQNVISSHGDPVRLGGYYALWRSVSKEQGGHYVPVCGFAVGNASSERFLKYTYFANEKAKRLSENPDHVSSWQSRDETDPEPMRRRYGGAIRCGRYGTLIFSFSGLIEVDDEAICVIAARELGQLDHTEASKIAQASQNPHLPAFLPPAPRPGP